MNFFEHQQRARKQSRRLIFVFLLAVLAIVIAIDLVLLLAVGLASEDPIRYVEGASPDSWAAILRSNAPLLTGGAIATVSVIGLASLFKTLSLRSGGGQVARQLGGVLVDPDTRDPGRRRLRNVVEEIAIASGVPVPEIYVLEQESGINAFAAGYTASDAAIAVTQGTLDKLDRSELQGVIAHEFSHILNGDMRVNIRLMGVLFGILLLALIGRRVLLHSRFAGRSRDRNGAALLIMAVALTAIGYMGLFFGRWIKAAVSRQREYLADASAVQFTRDPEGIGGALKKIAVYSNASYLDADTEEIGHMLFGSGRRMLVFSTHPPLEERIRRVDRNFRPEDLQRLAQQLQRERVRSAEAADGRPQPAQRTGSTLASGDILGQIGKPDWDRVLVAAALAAALPNHLTRAARDPGWAPEVLLYTLLDEDEDVRERQLLTISRMLGSASEERVRALLSAGGAPAARNRLPLMELAFPAIKRRPAEFIQGMLEAASALIEADRRIDVFEYLLARVLRMHLWQAHNPHVVRPSGRVSLKRSRGEALQVLAVLARHGHADDQVAGAAFHAGLGVIDPGAKDELPEVPDWVAAMDAALPRLDRLRSGDKQRLVTGLVAVATHDDQLAPTELELLRVTCELIHVPMPLLTGPRQTSRQS
jgi:Zn-dependent protease with chaperone function